jgi:hypothetical protein
VTVQAPVAPGPRLVGLHTRPDTSGATRLIVAVWELLPNVAVTIAVWLLAIEAAATALNGAEALPAATITEGGTASDVLLLPNATVDPPAGAFVFRATEQLEVVPAKRLPGLHVSDESTGTFKTPPEAVNAGSTLAVVSTAVALKTPIDVVPAPGASVT